MKYYVFLECLVDGKNSCRSYNLLSGPIQLAVYIKDPVGLYLWSYQDICDNICDPFILDSLSKINEGDSYNYRTLDEYNIEVIRCVKPDEVEIYKNVISEFVLCSNLLEEVESTTSQKIRKMQDELDILKQKKNISKRKLQLINCANDNDQMTFL